MTKINMPTVHQMFAYVIQHCIIINKILVKKWLNPTTFVQASRPSENWVLSTNNDGRFKPNGRILSEGWGLLPSVLTRRVPGGIPLTPSTLKERDVEETHATLPTSNKLLSRLSTPPSSDDLSGSVVKNSSRNVYL